MEVVWDFQSFSLPLQSAGTPGLCHLTQLKTRFFSEMYGERVLGARFSEVLSASVKGHLVLASGAQLSPDHPPTFTMTNLRGACIALPQQPQEWEDCE